MSDQSLLLSILKTHNEWINFGVIRQESELNNSRCWMALMDLVRKGTVLQNDRLFILKGADE